MARELLGTKEACEYLDVSYWTLIHELLPVIPHIQRTPRGKIKFRRSTLDKYLEKQEEESVKSINILEDVTPERKTDDIVELRKRYNNKKKNTLDLDKLLGNKET